ncbi:Multicopper oxidase, C-terminal [Dillenia turbinata]|uniref:Multicopper oxidase, C-terminal n=1 Tax=Dillenia turbinata TaxID=194707 RepID=A0AAN8ZMW8_9MAGN
MVVDYATNFTDKIKGLNSAEHPVDVPKTLDTQLIITVSVNTFPCSNDSCTGPNGSRLAASLNNVSFVTPSTSVLQAYFYQINGIYKTDFPTIPPNIFNFTADDMPDNVLTPLNDTKVRIIEFNSSVEIVFQGINVMNAAENHPMHLHGFSFYKVGSGFGNYNSSTDPA